jgi:hypothetical protein
MSPARPGIYLVTTAVSLHTNGDCCENGRVAKSRQPRPRCDRRAVYELRVYIIYLHDRANRRILMTIFFFFFLYKS